MINFNYSDYRNAIIVLVLQRFDPTYNPKPLPDYVLNPEAWKDIVSILKINKIGAAELNKEDPILKKFFAELTLNGKKFYTENLIGEKFAAVELCLRIAEFLKIQIFLSLKKEQKA